MPQLQPEHLGPLIGAGGVILGVLISQAIQWCSTMRERKHEQRKLLREKLESLMDAEREFSNWLAAFQAATEFQQAVALTPTEYHHRVETLVILYFPRLKTHVAELHRDIQDFHVWALRQITNGLSGNIGSHLVMTAAPEYKSRTQKIQSLRMTLMSAIENEVQSFL